MFIEAMADAGVKLGLPRAKAYKLAEQAILGSAKLALETGIGFNIAIATVVYMLWLFLHLFYHMKEN